MICVVEFLLPPTVVDIIVVAIFRGKFSYNPTLLNNQCAINYKSITKKEL
jgi:hypothetical protein